MINISVGKMHILLSSIFLLSNLFPSFHYCTAMDKITSTQPLTQEQTLTSPGQVFELGFFSPDNLRYRYVGLWYKNVYPRKVVWVANRERPLTVTDTLANLKIGSDGNLKLVYGKQITVWSTNVSVPLNDSFAAISDKGNVVLQSSPSGEFLWQSFDYPCHTILHGASIGMNSKTGERRFLISWKSENDPSPGKFSLGVLPQEPPQAFIWNGLNIYWRSGQWDKTRFIGIADMNQDYLNGYSLPVPPDAEQGSAYLTVDIPTNYSASHMELTSAGSLKITYWDEDEKQWVTTWEAPLNRCDVYGVCGPFGICKENSSPICRCLKGFKPKSDVEWKKGNWTGGCVRRTELLCKKNKSGSGKGKEDGFVKMDGMKLSDFSEHVNSLQDVHECDGWCRNNCSCLAYAHVQGIGCMIWATDLVDIQKFNSSGKDLWIRLAHSELGSKKQKERLIISFTVACIFIFLGVVVCWFRWKAKQRETVKETMKNSADSDTTNNSRDPTMENVWRNHLTPQDSTELPMFDFHSILVATNNFSMINKLGQGGFGPVYKGKLQDGKEIAVKRLSNSSGQGIEEFKNETILISKLQHRNLVRILGCCIEGEEKLLVYEYMPNKSLDKFLFDPTKGVQLGWAKRIKIIQGIARGLLYLHRDSCLRIIHRDLKASNILLDEDMNPKISDFGLARAFGETQDLANTHRVVGTFGYMSPEYAMGGIFSEKSDIFSFGVLLLEIISGKRNTSFHYHDQHLNLLGYAWQLWNENVGLDLMDKALTEPVSPLEVIRCVHVGLLCVQDHAADRPTMSSVVSMLSSETDRPQPKQPAFIFQSSLDYALLAQFEHIWSINEVTVSMVEAR